MTQSSATIDGTLSPPSFSFQQRPLYGGTMACDFPASWIDVSNLRQVPDHQECWMAKGGKGCFLVIEILEEQSDIAPDQMASHYFTNLAKDNGCSSEEVHFVTKESPAHNTHLSQAIPGAGRGLQYIHLGRDVDVNGVSRRHKQEARWVHIELCALRLPDISTDLLVILSRPAAPSIGEETATAASIVPSDEWRTGEWSEEFERIVSTLQVKDWGLFGEEEAPSF